MAPWGYSGSENDYGSRKSRRDQELMYVRVEQLRGLKVVAIEHKYYSNQLILTVPSGIRYIVDGSDFEKNRYLLNLSLNEVIEQPGQMVTNELLSSYNQVQVVAEATTQVVKKPIRNSLREVYFKKRLHKKL